MIQELLNIKPTDSFPEMCTRLGAFLGWKGSIPENAMHRAISDPDFANNLITCRNAPGFLEALLNDPKNKEYSLEDQPSSERVSNATLLTNAAAAFWRWGQAGFSIVDDQTLEARENACLTCENLVKPEGTLQKLVTSTSSDEIGRRAADCVCKLCGCNIEKKIRLPSESCPARHAEVIDMNRWGEPLRKTR